MICLGMGPLLPWALRRRIPRAPLPFPVTPGATSPALGGDHGVDLAG